VLQDTPPSVLNWRVPPVPVTVPRAIDPPERVQFVHVLLVIASMPVGADGVAYTVKFIVLLQPSEVRV
jgi:hypothetical protein